MWELALGIFTVVTTVAALSYAHYAYKQSVHAPILKLALGINGAYIEAPKQPIDITLRLDRSVFDIQEGETKGFPLPIVIRNAGTKTARDIILRARYSIILKVVSNRGPVEDVDRPEWIVIDHHIPDLNPKRVHKFAGDFLVPSDILMNGVAVETSAVTKDRKKVHIKALAAVSAIVEFVLYSADTEPAFLSCQIKIKKEDEPKA